VEKTETTKLPTYDPACYLCPGNARAVGGAVRAPHLFYFILFPFSFPFIFLY
jgi:galactose-1-phosphate uridylyltransferase